jgi:hypothetical protein
VGWWWWWRGVISPGGGELECLIEEGEIVRARDLDGAEGGEVWGEPLDIQEDEAPGAEVGDEVEEGDLRRLRHAGEHRFTEESAAEGDPVETTDELVALPSLYRVGVAEPVEVGIGGQDRGADPGLVAVGTAEHHLPEGGIGAEGESIWRAAQEAAEAMGQVEARVDGHDPARIWGKPAYIAILEAHWEGPEAVGGEDELRIDGRREWHDRWGGCVCGNMIAPRAGVVQAAER